MKTELSKDGKFLIITMPIIDPPTPSGSGKTLVVCSTRGNKQTDIEIGGKTVTIGLNAYIRKD